MATQPSVAWLRTLVLFVPALWPGAVCGDPPWPLGGPAWSAEAATDAYRRAESARLNAIGQQLDTIDRMLWNSGAVGYFRPGGAVSWSGPFGGGRVSWSNSYGLPGVFEPWPVVPGDIYGRPNGESALMDRDQADQPLGHEIIPDGRGGYVYRPLREAPAAEVPYSDQAALPPAVAGPATPRPTVVPPPPQPHQGATSGSFTSSPVPASPESIPAPPPVSIPREF